MKTFNCFHIDYETSSREEIHELPLSINVTLFEDLAPKEWYMISNEEIEELLANAIADRTGAFVENFNYTEVI